MGLLVLAGEQRLTNAEIRSYRDWVEKRLIALAAKQGLKLLPVEAVDGDPLPAVVDANRWIVHCPTCNGAEFAWRDTHLFMCVNCWNGENNYYFRPVKFPDRPKAIEQVLMARPNPTNRNWSPGESVAALEAENEAHGLPKGVG